jgi:hypothetical protein
MKNCYFMISKVKVLLIIIILVIFSCNCWGYGGQEDVLEQIEEWSEQAGQEGEIDNLMQLQQELMSWAEKMKDQIQDSLPNISMPGSNPEEEIDREYEMINQGYQMFLQGFESNNYSQEVTDVGQKAIKMRGYIIVDGKDEDYPNGERLDSLTLQYVVKEEFVGNIIISNCFDVEKQRFTEEKDYFIHTISNGIEVMSVSGQQCVETDYGIPSNCTRKECFSTYEKDSGHEYPGSHQDVLMGNPEGNKIRIEVQSPGVVFKSVNGEIARSLGCFGTDFILSKSEFEQFLEKGEFKQTKSVEAEEGSSPRCMKGSSITLYMKVDRPRCHVEVVGDGVLIFECTQEDGLTGDLTIEAKLREGLPASYQWKIVSGVDIVKFKDNEKNNKKVSLHPISSSRIQDDVIIKVQIQDYQGKTCVASHSFTVKKPTYVNKLSDNEIEAMGIKPYINYKELCKQGKCAFTEVGEPKVELIDGYKRIAVFQVLDQFGLPIEKAMFFKEKRWVVINNNKINIPSEEESDGLGQTVPINYNQPDGSTITMYSGNGTTNKDGKIIDELAIAFPKGTSGTPKGLDITVHQDMYIFDCFVGHVIQHYGPVDATSTLE